MDDGLLLDDGAHAADARAQGNADALAVVVGDTQARLAQRLGRLDVGDVTTFVACAGRHRDEGVFEAARYGIDRLKEIVPVWKKEIGANRSVWVEGHYRPTPDDN